MKGWIIFIVVVIAVLVIAIGLSRLNMTDQPPSDEPPTPTASPVAVEASPSEQPTPLVRPPRVETSLSPVTAETYYMRETTYSIWPEDDVTAPRTQARGRMIREDYKGARFRAYFAEPVTLRPAAGLLLVHPWWGLSSRIRKEAEQMAQRGYAVLAVDLYDGVWTTDRRRASELMANLEQAEAVRKLQRGLDYMEEHFPHFEGKIGVIGWGMGGGFALDLAMADPRPDAVVNYYGEVSLDPNRLAQIQAPVLGVFAELDGWLTPQRIEQFVEMLEQAGLEHEVHSFLANPGFALRPQTDMEEKYAQESRRIVFEFLNQHLLLAQSISGTAQ